jgi:hypothetical protein
MQKLLLLNTGLQNPRTASPGHDLGTAPESGIQHRCVDLLEVRGRSQGDC